MLGSRRGQLEREPAGDGPGGPCEALVGGPARERQRSQGAVDVGGERAGQRGRIELAEARGERTEPGYRRQVAPCEARALPGGERPAGGGPAQDAVGAPVVAGAGPFPGLDGTSAGPVPPRASPLPASGSAALPK